MAAPETNTVLVVDDEESIRDYLASVLRFEGYECLCFDESQAALKYLSEANAGADLVLADINMPGMGGMDLLRSVRCLKPGLPVVLVSGLYELGLALEALEYGAADYLRKPVMPSDVITLVGKYLRKDLAQEEEAVQRALQEYIAQRGDGPANSKPIEEIFFKLGFKRYETFQYSKRVAAYCRLFGERAGLSQEQLRRLDLGALLHDIGKIGIPRNVLLKPGALSDEEWEVMRSHPAIGYRLMAQFEELEQEAEIVYSHHERYDGQGYPRGVKGRDIPIGARLFAIIDTLDAITSDRPYRAADSIEHARHEIARMSGSQFDPHLVRVFLRIPASQLDAVRRSYPDHDPEEEAPPISAPASIRPAANESAATSGPLLRQGA